MEGLSWIGNVAWIMHLLLVIVVVLRVVSRRLYPGTSLAWLLLVVTVPYVGLALYVLIGERPLGRRRVRRMLQMREPLARWLTGLPGECRADAGQMPVGQGCWRAWPTPQRAFRRSAARTFASSTTPRRFWARSRTTSMRRPGAAT